MAGMWPKGCPGGWPKGGAMWHTPIRGWNLSRALEMRLDRPQEPGPRPVASLGSGPHSPQSTCSPTSCALPAWSPCSHCSGTLQTSTRSWCSKWSSSPRTCPSSGVCPPLAFQEENAPLNSNPTTTKQQGDPVNQPIPLPVPEAGLVSQSQWRLPSPLRSSGLSPCCPAPASAGPCPWRTRSPSSREPL